MVAFLASLCQGCEQGLSDSGKLVNHYVTAGHKKNIHIYSPLITLRGYKHFPQPDTLFRISFINVHRPFLPFSQKYVALRNIPSITDYMIVITVRMLDCLTALPMLTI